jgi:hypothetical protein
MKAECLSKCHSTVVEELLVDEYHEVWCQSCWDRLPDDEKEDSTVRAFASGDE